MKPLPISARHDFMLRVFILFLIWCAGFGLFFAVLLRAQTLSGTVTVTTSIAAVASTAPATGNPPPNTGCTFAPAPNTTPSAPQIQVTCNNSAGVPLLAGTIFPTPGSTNGTTVSVVQSGNNVTGIFTQPTAGGPVNFSVAANGVLKTGSM